MLTVVKQLFLDGISIKCLHDLAEIFDLFPREWT